MMKMNDVELRDKNIGRPKHTEADVIARFLSLVNKGDCWRWMGSIKSNGYGQIYDHNGKTVSTHRFAWRLWCGNIPTGICVLHKCDNRLCVRPDHLFLGTHQDNIDDAVKKKRVRFGQIHHKSKMTDLEIQQCRTEWKSSKDTLRIAHKYSVNKSTIQRIVNRSTRLVPTSETIFAKQLFSK